MAQRRALSRRAPVGLRRWAFIGLVLAVVVVHGCVTVQLSDRMADFSADAAMPKRVEVAYVRELAPSAPPVVAPRPAAPAAPKPRRQLAKAEPAASAASSPATTAVVVAAASEPEVPAESQALAASEPAPAPEPIAELPPEMAAASAPAAAPDVPAPDVPAPDAPVVAAAPAASAASAPAFEWPVSTRMSYQLTGMVRGEVNGQAQVEWVRTGSRYQVHLDVTLGLPIAPLVTRRMTSDGDITEQGLSPRRYDEDTKAAFRDRRRVTLLFEPGEVVFSNGQRHERQPGMQDAASQFVQFVWIFSTRPELLRRGNTLELPLALPRSVDRWVYDVQEEETLHTPFGPLQAFHVKPRRMSGRAGELRADIWFAPTLRYLPVRIRIHQDADTFIDLMLSRRPELAGP